MNIKNLNIKEEDVIVYKSFKVPNLRNLSQTYLEQTNYLNLRDTRFKREDVTEGEIGDNDENSSTMTTLIDEGVTDGSETATNDELNLAGDDSADESLGEEFISQESSTTSPSSSTTPYSCEEDDLDDDVTMKKINQVYIDEDDELMIISLDVELRRNIFYTIKVDFNGNMTSDKGLFYKLFGENTENPRFGINWYIFNI